MGTTGLLSKLFLNTVNTLEIHNLPSFLSLLESRRDPAHRTRGLLTISNHVSVLDDPVIWGGILPLTTTFTPTSLRWTLGAADICFKNPALSAFFTAGQVLPTHRSKHSTYGGPFQASITQAIQLLSAPAAAKGLYTTTGKDVYVSPAKWGSNRHAWVHVFPEGLVHQHRDCDLRYFKWGVARLILESEPAPDVVPMFIEGTQGIMPENRGFPRFLPRVGRRVRVAFGEAVDYERTFGDLRTRWRGLVERRGVGKGELGEVEDERLRFGREAQEIRIECARRIREEIMKVRRGMGFPEGDERFGLAETWREDGEKKGRYRSGVDGSDINQD
ncbi:hypothetical protein OQA88_10443 [Cercophora sp. LCS_1]